LLARRNDRLWRLRGLLGKNLKDHNRIGINAVYQAPIFRLVLYPQLMASGTDAWHWPGMGQGQRLATLQAA
jgi:hypothetical protein